MKKFLVAAVGLAVIVSAAPAVGADRNQAPTKSVVGPSSEITWLLDIGVGSDGTVYGSGAYYSSLFAYASTAATNASPVRAITGPKTLMQEPDALAVASQNRVWVRINSGATGVALLPGSATGNTAPIRTISGSNTGIQPNDVDALAVGPNGDLYVLNSENTSILVFDSQAGGNVEPKRVIDGPNTQIDQPADLAVDSAGTIYVAEPGLEAVLAFAPGAQGNVSPVRRISGNTTTLGNPVAVDVDSGRNLYVSDRDQTAVIVFGPSANGNVAPMTRLVGASSQLTSPGAIAVGADRRVYVLDFFHDAIRVFAPLVPFVKAGPVRALSVLGAKGAAVRKVTWTSPVTNVNAGAITGYRVVIKKGAQTLVNKLVGPGIKVLSVARKSLKAGTLSVSVAAVNKQGLGSAAAKTFKVS